MKAKSVAVLAASFLAVATPFAPSSAQSPTRSLSQSELQQAAQQHPQVVEQFGGPVDAKLNNYVASVGRRIADYTGVSNAPGVYNVTVLNSPVRNAFAVPGGYVYVTRELLALMNDEAELAFVLGHEMGHVAARHGQKRQTRNTLGQLGAAIAAMVTGSSEVGQIAGQLGQGLVLSYSRSQEREADKLGVQYLANAGYDLFAAPRLLSAMGSAESLDAQVQGRSQGVVPTWARSHPLSQDRVRQTTSLASQVSSAPTARSQNRDQFLAAIDGMLYGDDPRQGVVEGRQFRHPVLRLKFSAPPGYAIENTVSAVTISGNGGQAQFSTGRLTGDVGTYVENVFQSLSGGQGQVRVPVPQRTRVNGMDVAYATARAQTNQGQVDVTVFAYHWTIDTAYHFVMITPAGSGIGPFSEMVDSLAPLSVTEAQAIRPREVDVITVGPRDTVQSLAGRMAYPTYRLERFLVLNGLTANSSLRPGQKVKIIIYGRQG